MSPAEHAYLDMKYDASTPVGLHVGGVHERARLVRVGSAAAVAGVGAKDVLGCRGAALGRDDEVDAGRRVPGLPAADRDRRDRLVAGARTRAGPSTGCGSARRGPLLTRSASTSTARPRCPGADRDTCDAVRDDCAPGSRKDTFGARAAQVPREDDTSLSRSEPPMHSIRLLVVLAFAALLLAAPARPRRPPASSSARSSPAAATRARASTTTSSSSSTRARPRSASAAGPFSTPPRPATSWQATALAGSIPAHGYFLVQLNSSAADRRRAAGPRRDRHHQPRRLRRQGRARARVRRALGCGASVGQLLGCVRRRGPRRLRLGDRLRGSGRRAGAEQLDRRRARGIGGCTDTDSNARRLHGRRAVASKHGVVRGRPARRRRLRRRASSSPAAVDVDVQPVLSLSLERPTISFGAAVLGRHADADLRARDGRQQQRGRLLAGRAPLRVHAGRPAARAREHGSHRRDARRRSRRRGPGRDPDPTGGRPRRSARRRRASAVGRRCLADDGRVHRPAARRRARATTRRPSPTR